MTTSPTDIVDHRPWPVPDRPWRIGMTWRDLLFAHWPVSPAAVRPLVPRRLEIDTFDDRAWVGVIPFRMTSVRVRPLPPLPPSAAFEELNVRTYVTDGKRPGVWFFSLDAASRLAVVAARTWFGLDYRYARMACRPRDGWIDYEARRSSHDAEFVARYRPRGEPFKAAAGSLERWLTERYCLYAVRRGRTVRGDIHHAPWLLRRCEAAIRTETMTRAVGLRPPETEPHLLHSDRLDVVAWGPEPVA